MLDLIKRVSRVFLCWVFGFSTLISSAQDIEFQRDELKRATSDSAKARIALEIASSHAMNQDVFDEYIELALKYSIEGKYKFGEAKSRQLKGYMLNSKGQLKEAYSEFDRATEIFEEIEDRSNLAKTYLQHARGKSLEGQFNEAINLQKKALKVSQVIKDTVGLSTATSMIAGSYGRMGNFEKSLSYALLGLKYAEAMNDTAHLSIAYSNLMNIYAFNKKFDEALKYSKLDLALKQGKKDRIAESLCLENMGNIYLELKNPEKALIHYNKAGEILNLDEFPESASSVYAGMGMAHRQLGNFEKALEYLGKAESIYTSMQNNELLSHLYLELGLTEMATENFRSAKKFLSKSEKYAIEYPSLFDQSEVFKAQSRLYERLGNYKRAFSYSTQAHILKDSIFNMDSESAMLEMKEKYETEKKDLEIEVLTRQTELDNRKSERQMILMFAVLGLAILVGIIAFLALRQSKLKENLRIEKLRTKIAADLHDDVGSTLSSISMYTEVLNQKVSNTFPEMSPVLSNMRTSSRSLMNTISDIVWTINPKNNTIESLLKRIRSKTSALCEAKDVQFIYEGNTKGMLMMEMNVAQSIYLVLKEGINNAMKHSGCTRLHLTTWVIKSQFDFVLQDNGKGFKVGKESDGNGMHTMRKRMEEISGDLKIESGNSGTQVTGSVKL